MYDAIVIGAGPSGSMAASIIASKGFSVKLIERKKEIGHPVQCGEAIAEFCLKNISLSKKQHWIKWKVKGVKIILPNDKCFYSIEPALCIDRKIFDKWLVKKAVVNGADLKIGVNAYSVEGKPGAWTVKTTKGLLNSKILIGADGPSSKTARSLGLLKSREHIKALQYKFDVKDIKHPEDEWLCMYHDVSFSSGYGWIFPRGDEYNIGVVGPTANTSLLNRFCNNIGLLPNKKKELNAGLIPLNYEFITRAKEGVIIVGDAAGMTNPVTGGGIHAALFSGKMAGEITVQALESEDLKIMQCYDEKIKKTPFLNPIHLRTVKYFLNFTDKDWASIGESINKLNLTDLTLFKCLFIGLKYPRYLPRTRELLTIRKEMQINQKYG